MDGLIDRERAWAALATIDPRPGRSVDRATPTVAVDLPAPARRLLDRSLPAGPVDVFPLVIDMEGEMRLRRWMPFTARQLLVPGHGFVWNATVGRLVRFRGGDAYWQGRGSLEFSLAGIVPVARAAGPEVSRSAVGRLAAETVAWAPEALVPGDSVDWRPIDDTSATVSSTIDGQRIDVTVRVDADGGLEELVTRRWGTPPGGEPGCHPFGGAVTRTGLVGGTVRAIEGTVGWWWGTERQDEGEFFRYRVTGVRPVLAPGAAR